eukprot:16134646-Heterocapsa_arctica.AAC.1
MGSRLRRGIRCKRARDCPIRVRPEPMRVKLGRRQRTVGARASHDQKEQLQPPSSWQQRAEDRTTTALAKAWHA